MKTPPQNQDDIGITDDTLTVPMSLRLPARLAALVYLYAARMNTSSGKVVASLLEDTLPAFKESKNFEVTLRIPQLYRAMAHTTMLQSVNVRDLEDRILKRLEPGGPIGRPPKHPKTEE